MATSPAPEMRQLSHSMYTVAWVSPLVIEQIAAIKMLDEEHCPLSQSPRDHNVYKLGRIGNHNIVIAGLHRAGKASAASVVSQMVMTFPNLLFGLLVGIGGGVPCKTESGWIRLGHVVVGKPTGVDSGTVQYDHGKALEGGFQRTGSLMPPPPALLNAAQALEIHRKMVDEDPIWQDIARIRISRRELQHFANPGPTNDRLYKPGYKHLQPGESCEDCGCDPNQRIQTPGGEIDGSDSFVVVHRGTIASGDSVVKDAVLRDKLAEQYQVLCFEMEAAGVLSSFPCMVIRGISDYCDSHKNDQWHGFAAAAAAAYGRQLLFHMPFAEPAISYPDSNLAKSTFSDTLYEALPTTPESTTSVRAEDPILDKANLSIVDQAAMPVVSSPLTEDYLNDAVERWKLLCNLKQYKNAETYAREIVDIRIQELGEEHQVTLESQYALGWTLYHQENFEEAAVLFGRTANAFLQVLGEQHEQAMKSLYWRGRALYEMKKYSEAEETFKMVLEGDFNAHTNNAQSHLGWVHYAQMNYDAGEGVFYDLSDRLIRVFGKDNVETKRALYGLGCVLLEAQKYVEAEHVLRDLCEQRTQASGPDNQIMLEANYILGVTLTKLNKTEEAEKFLREAANGRLWALGHNHQETIKAFHSLGNALCVLQRYKEAEEILKEVVAGWQRILGPEHLDTLSSQKDLGSALVNLKKPEEAEKCLSKAYEGRSRTLGKAHVDTLRAGYWLGRALADQKKYKEAERVFREIAAERSRTFGEEHRNTLHAQFGLARALMCQDSKSKEAKELMRAILKIRRNILGDGHQHTILALQKLAEILYHRDELKEATEAFKKVVDEWTRMSKQGEEEALEALDFLGRALYKGKEYQEAEKTFERLAKEREQSLGEDHDLTVQARRRQKKAQNHLEPQGEKSPKTKSRKTQNAPKGRRG